MKNGFLDLLQEEGLPASSALKVSKLPCRHVDVGLPLEACTGALRSAQFIGRQESKGIFQDSALC